MPCVSCDTLTLKVNEQTTEKSKLFPPHIQNNLTTSQKDEEYLKSSFGSKHKPYLKNMCWCIFIFQNDFQNISDQSSLSFTPNWISFLGSIADDGFMIMNWIQSPLK